MENIQYPEYHEGATAIMSVYIRMWVLLDVTYRHTNHKTMKVKIIFKKWIVRCVSTVHLVLSVVFLISFRQQFLPMCLVYDFSLNDLLSPSNFFLSGFFFVIFFHQTISLICTSDDLDVRWPWILFSFFLSRKTADSDYPQCHHELSSLQEAEDGDSPGETGQICMLCWSSQVWCGKWMCLLKMT